MSLGFHPGLCIASSAGFHHLLSTGGQLNPATRLLCTCLKTAFHQMHEPECRKDKRAEILSSLPNLLHDSGLLLSLLSHVQLFAAPWTAAYQACLSFTISQSLLKPMFIESVMPSKHLILCHPLLLLPSIFPSIGVFSNESVLCIRWPKCWSFSLSNEYSGLIFFLVG